MPHKKAPYWALTGNTSLKLNKIQETLRYFNLMSSEDRCSYCLPHMRKPIQEASLYCMPYRIRPLGVKVFSLCLRNLQVLILFTSQDSCTQAVHLTGKVILLFRQSCINDVHSTFMCLTNLEDLILYISQERSTQHKSSRSLHHRGPLRRSFP